MLRVVLDTNILISAAISGGVPGRTVELALRHRYQLLISPYIFLEFRQTLSRKFGKGKREIDERIRRIVGSAEIIRPSHQLSILSDTGDNRVLGAPLKGKPTTLCLVIAIS